MRKFGLVAAVVVAGLIAGQAMGATMYLSQAPLATATATVPEITLNAGDTATLYLYAHLEMIDWDLFIAEDSNALGVNIWESVDASLVVATTDVRNPRTSNLLNPNVLRWNPPINITSELVDAEAGFSAVAIGYDPATKKTGTTMTPIENVDPDARVNPDTGLFEEQWVATFSITVPMDWAGGEVTNNLFLSPNSLFILGGMIGTAAEPRLHFGTGDAVLPVSTDNDGQSYLPEGLKSALPDAIIHVVPEPGSLALLALGGLALLRRR